MSSTLKNGIETLKAAAESRGGECLSSTYINSSSKYKFRCSQGHEWETIYDSVVRNKSWCPICVGQKVDLTEKIKLAKEVAIKNGGICLTDIYINGDQKLNWRCANGHDWEAPLRRILNRGSWCRKCAGLVVDADNRMKSANDLALLKGGKCLSYIYTTSKDKLKWACTRGHEWEASYEKIRRGTWCPICSEGISERLCRDALEKLFGLPFKKQRPKWLVNPQTKRPLELDGYNESLKLAFEYQGQQHYKIVHSFKMDNDILNAVLYRDEIKKTICKSNGIQILEIPYTIHASNILEWISDEIITNPDFKNFIKLIRDWKTLSKSVWIESDKYSINTLKDHAKNKGGECLSETFIGATNKYIWKCSENHKWEAAWTQIKNVDTWCPYCSGRVRDEPLKRLHDLAKSKGGKCLSKDYTRMDRKYRWQCSEGHQWDAPWGSVHQGSWCPECSGRISPEMQISLMQTIAKSKGGLCLSENYVTKSKLRFKCSEGHEWFTTIGKIKMGRWCHVCQGRLSPEENLAILYKLAISKGGSCLSESYVNSLTKMLWKCVEGHEWMAIPNSIKRGTWCQECAKKEFTPTERLNTAKYYANSKGGECLSDEYVDGSKILKWKCAKGHEWNSPFLETITRSKWCKYCDGSKDYKFDEAKQSALNNQGICLSDGYVKNNDPMEWQCLKGHIWQSSYKSVVKNKTWCPFCSGNKINKPLEILQEIAKSKGGLLLSSEYLGAKVKLKWMCSKNHQWEACPRNITRGSWCKICNKNAFDPSKQPVVVRGVNDC